MTSSAISVVALSLLSCHVLCHKMTVFKNVLFWQGIE